VVQYPPLVSHNLLGSYSVALSVAHHRCHPVPDEATQMKIKKGKTPRKQGLI